MAPFGTPPLSGGKLAPGGTGVMNHSRLPLLTTPHPRCARPAAGSVGGRDQRRLRRAVADERRQTFVAGAPAGMAVAVLQPRVASDRSGGSIRHSQGPNNAPVHLRDLPHT